MRADDGALDLYNGLMRAVDKDGRRVVNEVVRQRYLEFLAE